MVFCVIRRKPYHLFWIGEEGMKASFDVTLSPKDLYRFNMYQTYTGFQGWSSIALGILGFVMAGISFQNGKTSYTLLYIAVGFLFLLYIPVALWFRAKETLKTNKVLAGTLHYEITEKNIHVSQGKETGDMEWQAIYKIVANAKQILIYSNRKSAYIFTQGIAQGLGIEEPICSPTFTIVQVYEEGRMPFYHFDVYRIGDIEEMDEIGYEDYFYGEGLTMIEWANLIEEILPDHYREITIEKDLEKGFDYRKITILDR